MRRLLAALACATLLTATTTALARNEAETFPLHVHAGDRHLTDASGAPFLIHGDTAWSLIAALRREEVEAYLDDRRTRGFNTLLVSLLEHRFARNAPANAYGEQPFLASDDFGSPNERYFAHADWVLRSAAAKGFLVLLTPAYLGAQGGSDGWYQAMLANGPDKLRAYGRFVGARYRDFGNIMWIHGGDYDPPNKDVVRAVASGIREAAPNVLQSVHGGPESAALDHWRGEPWLDVNTVYTYGDVRRASLTQWRDGSRMPFFLIESFYENEHETTTPQLRRQAYEALLSGATGQVFGNNPIWHFDGPGLFPAPATWREALDSPGAHSMSHVRKLLSPRPWWTLEPDVDQRFVTSGSIADVDQPVAAVARNGSFAIVYLPAGRAITVDLGKLAGPKIHLRWFDPAAGCYTGSSTTAAPADGRQQLHPPGANAAGHGDWVLVAEAR